MKQCCLCGTTQNIQRHHVFGGTANRKLSEKYGLCANLCMACHIGDDGVHFNQDKNLELKRIYQHVFEIEHTREEFRKIFGKSYL